jgi:hypothetical protein
MRVARKSIPALIAVLVGLVLVPPILAGQRDEARPTAPFRQATNRHAFGESYICTAGDGERAAITVTGRGEVTVQALTDFRHLAELSWLVHHEDGTIDEVDLTCDGDILCLLVDLAPGRTLTGEVGRLAPGDSVSLDSAVWWSRLSRQPPVHPR